MPLSAGRMGDLHLAVRTHEQIDSGSSDKPSPAQGAVIQPWGPGEAMRICMLVVERPRNGCDAGLSPKSGPISGGLQPLNYLRRQMSNDVLEGANSYLLFSIISLDLLGICPCFHRNN